MTQNYLRPHNEANPTTREQKSFYFDNNEVRTVTINSEIWFIAKDVCEILEINDSSQAVERLSDRQKLTRIVYGSGQGRKTWLINEAGLYKLVFTSRKPEAEKFTDWVTSEVLPSIRKTGSYNIQPKAIDRAEFIRQAMEMQDEIIKELKFNNMLLKDEVDYLQPKANFYDTVMDVDDLSDMRSVAKLLNLTKGSITLYKILRDEHILDQNNLPYQQYLNRNYFVVKEKLIRKNSFEKLHKFPLVTQKGIDYINRLIMQKYPSMAKYNAMEVIR